MASHILSRPDAFSSGSRHPRPVVAVPCSAEQAESTVRLTNKAKVVLF
jgi:hypothetical protein